MPSSLARSRRSFSGGLRQDSSRSSGTTRGVALGKMRSDVASVTLAPRAQQYRRELPRDRRRDDQRRSREQVRRSSGLTDWWLVSRAVSRFHSNVCRLREYLVFLDIHETISITQCYTTMRSPPRLGEERR